MEQLINVKYISSCGDNNLYTVYISRFYENLNYRRKYDPLFHFYYIFYISSSWVLVLYKSIENWCYKQIKLTPWRCVHFDFLPNFQCSWRDFERTGVILVMAKFLCGTNLCGVREGSNPWILVPTKLGLSVWIIKENAAATKFEPHECVIFFQSMKIGTYENKAIHSI